MTVDLATPPIAGPGNVNAAAVEVRGLSITVAQPDGARKAIVEDIDFAIPRGEVLALIGELGIGQDHHRAGADGLLALRGDDCRRLPAGG